MNKIRFAFVAFLSSFALVVACGGVDSGKKAASEDEEETTSDDDDDLGEEEGGDDLPDDDDVPPPAEPDDEMANATPLTGTGAITFSGQCLGDDDRDYFAFTTGVGQIQATLTWTEGTGNEDVDLYIFNDDYSIDGYDIAIPPGDSPAEVTTQAAAAGPVFLEVSCYFVTTPNLAYSGTLTIP